MYDEKPVAVIKRNDEYLQHWGKKKDHKYVRKELVNGKWRYFYEEAKDKISDTAFNVGFEIGYAAEKARDKARNILGTKRSDVVVEKNKALQEYYDHMAPNYRNYRIARSEGKSQADIERIADHMYDMDVYTLSNRMEENRYRDKKTERYKKFNEINQKKLNEVNKSYAYKKRYEKAKQAYDKTLIGFSKKTINKGKEIVDDILWNIDYYLFT